MQRARTAYSLTALAALIAFAVPRPGLADTAGARQLTAIDTVTLPGGRVEVDLTLSQPASKPLTFSVDQPPMIVLDLDNTSLGLSADQRNQSVNAGSVEGVQAVAADGRTRVVLNLAATAPYETHVDGNHVYVTVGGGQTAVAGAKPPVPAEKTFGPASGSRAATATAAAPARAITDVEFHRTPDGSGRVSISLSDSSISGSVSQEGKRVVVSFPDTEVPSRLEERLDVTDFATPVTSITTQQTNGGAQIVIEGSGNFDQLAFQADNTFAVELKPVTEQQLAVEGKKHYTGKKLTLNFQNIPVRAVLQILADFTGKNIVVSGSVNGNITLRLHDVPWDEALDIILKTQGLAMHQTGDVLMIAPATEFARQEQAQAQAQNQIQQSMPLDTAYIQINYAKASDLAKLIQSQKNSLLSDRGSVTVDTRTNTLIVHDTDDHISQVRGLVRVLDIPVRQVLIESRVVIATNTYARQLGVRFGVTGIHQGNNSLITTAGNLDGTNQIIANQQLGNSPSGPYPVPDLGNQLNVNVPTANPFGQFAVSILNKDFLVDLELSAMQAEGNGEVVSSPRVITANQQQATIEQGVEIPYQNASASGATTVQFKKAVLSLQVTPQITPDNRILMQIEVHKDSVGEYVPTANGGQVPSIDTRDVLTNVLVDNGDTVVLGGIYEITQSKTINKVPLLGDIPLLGFLFRNTQVTNDKDELLIFVTPKILAESLAQ